MAKASAELLAAARVTRNSQDARLFHFQNWGGLGWKTLQGDNAAKLSFVEGWGVLPCLPNGLKADPILTQMQQAGDRDGFQQRLLELLELGAQKEAPGVWGDVLWTESQTKQRVKQLCYLFVDARKGDLAIMTSSGKHAAPGLNADKTQFAIGIFTTEPTCVRWMEPTEIGTVHRLEGFAESVHGDSGFAPQADGSLAKALAGPLGVRPVVWVAHGLKYDLPVDVRKYFDQLVQPTINRLTGGKLGLDSVFRAFLQASTARPVEAKALSQESEDTSAAVAVAPLDADAPTAGVGAMLDGTSLPAELGSRRLFHANLFTTKSSNGFASALGANEQGFQWVAHWSEFSYLPTGASPDAQLTQAWERRDDDAFFQRAKVLYTGPGDAITVATCQRNQWLRMRKGDVVVTHKEGVFAVGMFERDAWDGDATFWSTLAALGVDHPDDRVRTAFRAFRRITWLHAGDLALLDADTVEASSMPRVGVQRTRGHRRCMRSISEPFHVRRCRHRWKCPWRQPWRRWTTPRLRTTSWTMVWPPVRGSLRAQIMDTGTSSRHGRSPRCRSAKLVGLASAARPWMHSRASTDRWK